MVKAPIDFRLPDRDTLENASYEAIPRAEFKPEDWKQNNTHAARALAVSSVDLILTMYGRIISHEQNFESR
jgi:hypothetical protein